MNVLDVKNLIISGQFFSTLANWFMTKVLTLEVGWQLLLVLTAFGIAWRIGKRFDAENRLENWITSKTDEDDPWLRRLGHTSDNLIVPIIWLVLQWGLNIFMSLTGSPHEVLRITVSLLNAWVLIHLVSSLAARKFWQKAFALFAWSIAALYVLNLLSPAQQLLDSYAFNLGSSRLSPYIILKGILIGAALLWLAGAGSKLIKLQLTKVPDLTPSVEVLILKLVRFCLIFLAIIIALSAVGIELTSLAVLSGAIGIGIGFGLQKIISNFISGIILLLDRSIRPGDVIEVAGTYGQVKNLGARYTSVITRDGTEYLIPNENMITEQVINWSYSNTDVRRKIPIGVSYNADIDLARALVLEACAETKRIMSSPEPKCHLVGFGDNSVDLEARFWICDPHNGVINVKSDFLLKVWHKFRDNNIEIPFPQRDLNIRGGSPIEVCMTAPDTAPKAKRARRGRPPKKPQDKDDNRNN
ncbi:MAG: mechanosensitive ion channel [bacterium]|nr:mechanosensitive ion channel [bacterium]